MAQNTIISTILVCSILLLGCKPASTNQVIQSDNKSDSSNQPTTIPIVSDNTSDISYVLPDLWYFGHVMVNDDNTVSYPKDSIYKIDFKGSASQKYVFMFIVSCGVRNTATVGWNVYLISCPVGGNTSIVAHPDETTLDGSYSAITKIPISIDSNAPIGTYLFKIAFFKK